MVTGPAVQAGSISGGIHIGGPSRNDQQPWQFPPAVKVTDRAKELKLLESFRGRAAREGRPASVVISGLGGVGKTVLALSWLHGIRSLFPDGQLYADLGAQGSGGPVDPAEVLGRFLRSLGVSPEQIPQSTAEQSGLYRSLTTNRRLVVLLDDAVSAAQVRPLLPGGLTLAAVTSRWRLPGLSVDGCSALHLEPLNPEAAVELLACTLDDERVENEPAQARELVDLCARLPLAVRVAGARLAARPQRPITTMVQTLAEEHDRLDALAIQGDHTVRATLELSYRGLSEPAARLYRLLALHPGPNFSGSVAVAALAGPGPSRRDTESLLDQLLDASLISDAGNERYRFHDLVRLHAATRVAEEENCSARAAARRSMFDYYLATATRAEETIDPHHRSLPRDYANDPPVIVEDFGGDSDLALAWLEEERVNLMAVVRQARQTGFPTVTWQLADAMWSLFVRRKHYADWRTAHQEGVAAARTCGDLAAESRMLTSGGLGELGMAGHARALDMFTQAADLFQRQGDALGYARTWNYTGLAYQRLGLLEDAVRAFEKAAAECPRYGDRRAGALACLNLADVAITLHRYDDAERQATAARRVLEDEGDPYNAARASTLIGRAHLGHGHLGSAEQHLTVALATLRPMAASYEVARALEALAATAEHQGQMALARERYQEAFDLYTALNVPAAEPVRTCLDRLDEDPQG